MEVLAILTNLLKILAAPGGEAALSRVFADHNMSVDSVVKIVANLKPPPPLSPPADDHGIKH